MTDILDDERDHNRLHRRAFLAAGTAAAVLAGGGSSFAQSQTTGASAPGDQGAMPGNVRVERLDGSILLIGIRQESDRVELSSVIGLGRLMYMLDHDDALRAEFDGDAYEEAVNAVLALQVGGTGHNHLLVEQDGVDHLQDGGGGREVGAAHAE